MKKNNNKGFTLIELLAVIVIMAILVAVAIPAVTRYLDTARKGTFADNANAAVSAVRNHVISQFGVATSTTYYLNSTGCYQYDTKNKVYNSVAKTKAQCTGANLQWRGEVSVNDLLEKKLKTSSFGSEYDEQSNIEVVYADGAYTYKICLYDKDGNGIVAYENNITDAAVKENVTSCTIE